MKKTSILIVMILAALLALGACGGSDKKADEGTNYLEVKDLKADIESGNGDYVILDVRKLEDYEKSHIVGSIDADVHAANKEGDDKTGTEHLKAALKKSDGSETGSPDKKYALVCYTGKSYASKATELLKKMGLKDEQIFTVKGGIKEFEAGGDEYKSLIE